MKTRLLKRGVSLFGAMLLLLFAAPCRAQYFGQNRVRYRSFAFRVLSTEHYDIYYYPIEEQAARIAARLAERWNARLSKLLDFQLTDRQPIILYADQPDFQQTNTLGGEQPGEGTGGVTEPFKRRVILPFAGPLGETDHVLGHELVHAFQYAITGQRSSGGFRAPAATRLPLWFIEGMAEYLSLGPIDPQTAMWMRDAVKRDKLPSFKELNSEKYFPYRWGQAFWAYIAGRWGDPVVGKMLKEAGRNGDAEGSIKQVLDMKPEDLVKEWHAALKAAYGSGNEERRSVKAELLLGDKRAGRMNLAPAVSPDGRELVFLSEKSLFAVEMFLADTGSGRVTKKLSEAALDPHLDSLEFIASAGSWDRDGRRFVSAVVEKGRPALSIITVASGREERMIPLQDLGEIFNPTWSPDERRIAFTGQAGGLTDLYIYDLVTNHLDRLTEDVFADIHPAWSPDGKTIAFATDRFSSNIGDLSFGDYQLALIDPNMRQITPLPTFPHGKSINPQWSPDSSSLYFISDRDGVSNVYRIDRATGRVFQITDLATGASGITDVSPALSSAAASRRILYSVYEDDQYRIYAINDENALAGRPVEKAPPAVDAALLPPEERADDEVVALRRNADFGLPQAVLFKPSPYKPHLSLDYVSQPYVAVGADRFGSYIGGGTGLVFSDMLGDHVLNLTFQANGGFKDIALLTGYTNLGSRLNWGFVAGQVPYVYADYLTGYLDGAYIEQDVIYRQIDRQVGMIAAYPFSRAQRLEATGGYRHISFDQEVDTSIYDPYGDLIDYQEEKSSPGDALNLAEGSLALVYDTSVVGATSPLLGRRYRFEVGGATGSLKFGTLLADYRQYVMPLRKLTIAGRLMHYGRYGKDAESYSFYRLDLGSPGLVRGYETDSFSVAECEAQQQTCRIIDRVTGSKLVVGNVELRFPLLGILGGSRYYGPFPIEGFLFADAGVAWSRGETPKIFGQDRTMVSSAGAGLRINFFGFAVAELDYVKPFDRPVKGAHWQFSLVPGF